MTTREEFLEKPLPSNEDAEKQILGNIILDNASGEDAFIQLVPSDFHSPLHRRVFQSMLKLRAEGQLISPISIVEHWKLTGQIGENFVGTQEVTNLAIGIPFYSNLLESVLVVKKHSVARNTIRVMNESMNLILGEQDPIEGILDNLERQVLTLSTKIHSEKSNALEHGFHGLEAIVPALEAQFKDYHAGISSGAPTGMEELDELLDGGGLQPDGIYLIAASEKTGKTSLALDWAYHGAVVQGLTVPIVTLEMSKETMAKRLYSAHTAIPYYRFRPGFYDTQADQSYSKAIEGLADFAKFPIKIADRLFGLPEISRALRRTCELGAKTGQPVKYAIIDYLQLISPDAHVHAGSREREVSAISRGLTILAAELGIAIVVMSSLNRENLKEGQEPTPFNLRDSGQLAFDCTALIFLHNPAYIPGKPYVPQTVTDMTMILSRQRNGPTGRIPMKFIGPYMQFMTENQYRRHNSKGEGLPQSSGQVISDDKEFDKLWDNPPHDGSSTFG